MAIHSFYRNDSCILRLDGPLTIYEAHTTMQRLLDELRLAQALEIDLAGIAEFDTAGLQVLLALKREANKLEKPVAFHGHSRAVLEVIDLCNLGSMFGDPVVIGRAP